MPRPISFCSVPDCGRRCHGQGLCEKHYARKRLYGKIYLHEAEEIHVQEIAKLPYGHTWHEWMIWAAGFFDGDGSVSIFRQSAGYLHLKISVAQVKKEPVEILYVLFGGGLRLHRREPSSRYQPTWNWYATGAKALRALKQMVPWMVGKREQARLAIEFQENMRHRGPESYDKEEQARRSRYRERIRALNSRISPF